MPESYFNIYYQPDRLKKAIDEYTNQDDYERILRGLNTYNSTTDFPDAYSDLYFFYRLSNVSQ